MAYCTPLRPILFQSTPSGGKATVNKHAIIPSSQVSIHAFRGEGDLFFQMSTQVYTSFNPRLPGGRRRSGPTRMRCRLRFQSTPSGGKATTVEIVIAHPPHVSIHAFRGEGDLIDTLALALEQRFNPRLPGGRRLGDTLSDAVQPVSIHAFRGEGDHPLRRITSSF